MEFLYQHTILNLGTVRLNRLPNNKQPTKPQQSKLKKRTSIKHITSYRSAPISVVTWKDNKAVSLLSTFCGELSKSKVQRYDKK